MKKVFLLFAASFFCACGGGSPPLDTEQQTDQLATVLYTDGKQMFMAKGDGGLGADYTAADTLSLYQGLPLKRFFGEDVFLPTVQASGDTGCEEAFFIKGTVVAIKAFSYVATCYLQVEAFTAESVHVQAHWTLTLAPITGLIQS